MLRGKKVVIVGTGKSGLAAGKLLEKEQAEITYYNSKQGNVPEEIKDDVIVGDFEQDKLSAKELLVFSPGVSPSIEIGKMAKKAGIPIWGEVELAYAFEKGTVVAITGTNGKTTTTSLVGEIMKEHYKDVYVVGNIGIPYTEMVKKTSPESITVAEISSFQLETIIDFHPHISAILNVTPDHLDRHGSLEEYTKVKCDITKNQTMDDVCVLNYEDDVLRERAKSMKCQTVFFSSAHQLEDGCYLDGDDIIFSCKGEKTKVVSTDELNILGKHSYENAMAAILMAHYMHVSMDEIRKALRQFVAAEHRLEFVCERDGVNYYNDSKGTNVDASIQAVRAMNRPTYLIGGGYDKGVVFDELIQNFDGKIKKLVLLGATAPLIKKTALTYGFENIVEVGSLKEAVDFCRQDSQSGDAVLLSPACASWDMFKSYEERGRLFKEYVKE